MTVNTTITQSAGRVRYMQRKRYKYINAMKKLYKILQKHAKAQNHVTIKIE